MGVLDEAIREHLELKRQHGASEDEVRRAEQEALGPARRDLADLQDVAGAPVEPLDAAAPAPMPGAGAPPPTPESDHLVPDPLVPAPQGDPVIEEASSLPLEPAPGEAPTEHMSVPEQPAAPPEEPQAPPPAPPAETVVSQQPPPAPTREDSLAEQDFRPAEETAGGDDVVEGEAHPFPEQAPPEPPAPGPTVAGDLPEEPPVAEPHEADHDEHAAEEPEFEPHPLAEAQPEERSERDDLLEDTPDFLQETPEHDRLWFEQRPPRDFDFDD